MKSKRSKKKKAKPVHQEVEKLGARIRELRIKEGFSSFEEFANDRGIHRAQIGRYEAGQNMNYTTLVRVVKMFGITLEEFFSEGFD